jgi:hypothetical protein
VKHIISEWRASVYGAKDDKDNLPFEEWQELRSIVIERDKLRCYRCDKKFPSSKLSVHHIIPRVDGGSNDITNLISLCNPCHDYVEINGLKTKADIMGSYEMPGVNMVKLEDVELGDDPYNRPEWHLWVYGGMKKSQVTGGVTKYNTTSKKS